MEKEVIFEMLSRKTYEDLPDLNTHANKKHKKRNIKQITLFNKTTVI